METHWKSDQEHFLRIRGNFCLILFKTIHLILYTAYIYNQMIPYYSLTNSAMQNIIRFVATMNQPLKNEKKKNNVMKEILIQVVRFFETNHINLCVCV